MNKEQLIELLVSVLNEGVEDVVPLMGPAFGEVTHVVDIRESAERFFAKMHDKYGLTTEYLRELLRNPESVESSPYLNWILPEDLYRWKFYLEEYLAAGASLDDPWTPREEMFQSISKQTARSGHSARSFLWFTSDSPTAVSL
ncbi:MAG: hypothetical protein CW346_17220 [Bacillaceae bacterium]|nr:hypothetical protein [Bacillaceae bacterium]